MTSERRIRKWERTCRNLLLELIREVSFAEPNRYAGGQDDDIWLHGSRLRWDDVSQGIAGLGSVGGSVLPLLEPLGDAYAREVAPEADGVAADQSRILAAAGTVLASLPDGFGIVPPLVPSELDFTLRNRILGDGDAIARLFASRGMVAPRLYGSVLRGDVDGYSDIDLAAESAPCREVGALDIIHVEQAISRTYGRDASVLLFGVRPTRADADALKGESLGS